jgi:hypothetical protein
VFLNKKEKDISEVEIAEAFFNLSPGKEIKKKTGEGWVDGWAYYLLQ